MSHPPTFRLDQPSGAADGSEDNELGKVGIVCGEIVTHYGIIGRIPQVGDGLGYVVCCGSRLGQEGGDVLHHAFGLPDDITLIQDGSLVIDAGRARDQYVCAIGIVDGCTSFEGDPILIGGVEMGRGIELLDLFGSQSLHGIGIHLYPYLRIGMASLDTGAGNVVGLLGQSLGDEEFPSGFHHTRIIDIHILHEEPGT